MSLMNRSPEQKVYDAPWGFFVNGITIFIWVKFRRDFRSLTGSD